MGADHPTDAGEAPSIVVVGGTGHVGAPLCLHLADRGHRVVATSRTASPGFGHPAVAEVRLDLRHPTEGLAALRSGAAPGTAVVCPWVLDGEADPEWLEGLLDHLAGGGLRTVVSFSTVWVYGGPPSGLLTEGVEPRPTSAYGEAHLANERTLERAAARHGLDVAVLRMSNLVGADPFHSHRAHDAGAKVSFTHDLATMALLDDRIVLRSPPSTPRDLLARARLHHRLDALLQRPTVAGRFEAFNVGGGRTTTMGAFARTVADAAAGYHGRPVAIEHPVDPGSVPAFDLDSSRIEALAGPHPNDLDREVSLVIDDVLAAGGGHR